MLAMKTIHSAGIMCGTETIHTVLQSSRSKLIYQLNCWLFDYSRSHNLDTIYQLPPLDDWSHSIEDQSYWSVQFPTPEWTIWIRSELLEFE